ncbi:CD209 antigen-like protein C isoform X2 [Gadus morhua]|uniref:CD209 antigen-like protein C isoform X2 n=1 Tax=Gadus morhua TaxID=8049 RepID=UPI0011B776AF|nr:CD209 antigen-like protein C isoform X2 [Gadus morhua]
MDTTYEQDSEVNEEYVNMPVIRNVMMKREYGGKPLKCIVVGFGLLCILQAILNVSLRLYSQTYQTDESDKSMNLMGENTKQDWLYFNNTFYLMSSTMKSWKDSREDCLQRNADLVVINSRVEQDFIMRWHIESWIGLSIRGTEGNWEWVDGTSITLSYWEVGEPNRYKQEEDCVEVGNNNWADVSCNDLNLWICEKKASPTAPIEAGTGEKMNQTVAIKSKSVQNNMGGSCPKSGMMTFVTDQTSGSVRRPLVWSLWKGTCIQTIPEERDLAL